MKKLNFSIILCMIIMVLTAQAAIASDNVKENPDLKIMINGKIGEYTDTPIIINERTLLPLRALLINLGIKNDEQHIIWDKTDRSITIFDEGNKETGEKPVKVFLKIDSTNAFVNDKAVALDAPAILYKDRTYIPARFIAQSLGREVVWDGETSTVLIQEKVKFDKIKGILEKSNASMSEVKRARFSYDETSFNSDGEAPALSSSGLGEVDIAKKVLHFKLNVLSLGQNSETYFANGAVYVKNSGYYEWIKSPIPNEQFESLFTNSKIFLLNKDEELYAGLNYEETDESLVLKGDVLAQKYAKLMGTKSSKSNVEVLLEKETFRLKRIVVNTGADITSNNSANQKVRIISMSFKDYNGAFEVSLPEDVEKNAVQINIR